MDHRADVYALGLILNEMFTGELRLGTNPKLIATVAPKYGFLDSVVDRMLRQNPDDRPSVVEVKAALFEGEHALATAVAAGEVSAGTVIPPRVDEDATSTAATTQRSGPGSSPSASVLANPSSVAKAQQFRAEPVSYTHLTLPTN